MCHLGIPPDAFEHAKPDAVILVVPVDTPSRIRVLHAQKRVITPLVHTATNRLVTNDTYLARLAVACGYFEEEATGD